MKLYTFLPNQYLYPYISRYWIWENESCLPKIFSGTGAELMFTYGEPLNVIHKGEILILPKSYVMMPRFDCYQLQSQGKYGFISVRFRAGAFRHFCPNSSTEFIDAFISIDEFWGMKGMVLQEKLMLTNDAAGKIKIIEQYLMRLLLENQKMDRYVDAAVNLLLYNYQRVNINELSQLFFVSPRQMERKLKIAVGVSPKGFQKISRFEALIKKLLLLRETKYLKRAMDYGYYDQSHFLKDCKKYLGETPCAFLQEKNFSSHFYNETLHI